MTDYLSFRKAVLYMFDIKSITIQWMKTIERREKANEFDLFNKLFSININGELYYSKSKIDKFNKTHISFKEIFNDIEPFVSKRNLKAYVLEEKCNLIQIDSIKFATNTSYRFIKKNQAILLIEYLKFTHNIKSELLTGSQIMSALNLANYKKDLTFAKYNIEPIIQTKRETLYHKKDLFKLINIQDKLLDDLRNNYVTLQEFYEMMGFKVPDKIINKKDATIKAPIICTNNNKEFKYELNQILIRKDIFIYDEAILQRAKDIYHNRQLDKFLDKIPHNPYAVYSELINLMGIDFSTESEFTKFYWNDFVRNKLNNFSTKRKALKANIMLFARLTNSLSDFVTKKDIYNHSTKSIKLAFFQEAVPLGWQQHLYSFLYNLSESFKKEGLDNVQYNISEILNPKHKIGQADKSIYSIEEYLNLINYISDTSIHKSIAINEAKYEINNERRFYNYSDMWLYVIILLNNSWRKDDVLDFPSLPDKYFKKIDLNWLLNNDLTDDDITFIADYYKNVIFHHNKTKQLRFFTISDDLKKSFAYAVIISTITQREIGQSNKIFTLTKESVYYKNHDFFFKNSTLFDNKFQFRSLKANRTLMSYMHKIIGELIERDPIEFIKFHRGHSSAEITNIYVDIPENHINFISRQLFDFGNFGFIYDTLSQIIFDDNSSNQQKTKRAELIQKHFGSIETIESASYALNQLMKENDLVSNILKKAARKEIKEKFNLINLGLSPSKDDHYQCLVSRKNCVFESRECIKCPFSVPNFYSITSIDNRLQKTLAEFEVLFENTTYEAEEIRLSNQLFIEINTLKAAIDKYGRDRINNLITGGLNGINNRLSNLSSFKEHLTITEGDVKL